MCVVHKHIVDSVAVFTKFDGFQIESITHKSAVHLLAEKHFLAMAQMDSAVGSIFSVSDMIVDAVVEYHTVLKQLYDRCTTVASGGNHYLLRRGKLHID